MLVFQPALFDEITFLVEIIGLSIMIRLAPRKKPMQNSGDIRRRKLPFANPVQHAFCEELLAGLAFFYGDFSMPKKPWFKFYPSDWLGDAALRSCSVTARGIWIDMLCIMDQSSPRGWLKIGERFMTAEEFCCNFAAANAAAKSCVDELRLANVFSETEGKIFSRKMIREEELSECRSFAGAKGAAKKNILLKQNGQQNVASGFLASSSSEEEEGECRGGDFQPPDFDVAAPPELPAEFAAPPDDFRVNPDDDPVRQVLHAFHRLTTLAPCGGMEAHEVNATKAAIRRHCGAHGAQTLVDEMVQRYAAAGTGKKPRSIKWFLQAWADMGGGTSPQSLAAEARIIREREDAQRKKWREQNA